MNPRPDFESFEEEIKYFLEDFLGAESIDRLMKSQRHEHGKRADYLAFNRNAIVELKSLESDRRQAVQDAVDEWRKRADWPTIFGSSNPEQVFAAVSDGHVLKSEVLRRLTVPAKRALEVASKQILASRSYFRVPRARGILMLLNERLPGVGPSVLATHLRPELRRTYPNGARIYEGVDSILMLFSSHILLDGKGRSSMISTSVTWDPLSEVDHQMTLESAISESLAGYVGVPYNALFLPGIAKISDLHVFGPELRINARRHQRDVDNT